MLNVQMARRKKDPLSQLVVIRNDGCFIHLNFEFVRFGSEKMRGTPTQSGFTHQRKRRILKAAGERKRRKSGGQKRFELHVIPHQKII